MQAPRMLPSCPPGAGTDRRWSARRRRRAGVDGDRPSRSSGTGVGDAHGLGAASDVDARRRFCAGGAGSPVGRRHSPRRSNACAGPPGLHGAARRCRVGAPDAARRGAPQLRPRHGRVGAGARRRRVQVSLDRGPLDRALGVGSARARGLSAVHAPAHATICDQPSARDRARPVTPGSRRWSAVAPARRASSVGRQLPRRART
jgi:hypothetical protein